MTSGFVDRNKLVFPGGEPALSVESGAALADGSFIIVTQAFCPQGHDLVAYPGANFDGFPGISIRIAGEGASEVVTISPMHGDDRRAGGEEFVAGTPHLLACPVCDEELPVFADCDCGSGRLRSIDLVRGGGGEVVALCDVAGCRRSRVAEGLEVLALFDE
jgi:hypothetical protein